jgi:hypothetical protein
MGMGAWRTERLWGRLGCLEEWGSGWEGVDEVQISNQVPGFNASH